MSHSFRRNSPSRKEFSCIDILRHLRLALALSLAALLLASAPFIFHVSAQQDSAVVSDPAEAFSAKADPLLKMVYHAAQEDRGSVVNNQASVMSSRAFDGDGESKLDHLSRMARVEREPDGTATVGVLVRLASKSESELKAAGFAVGARIGHIATVRADVERLPELAALSSVRRMGAAKFSQTLNDRARQAVKIDNTSGQRIVSQTGRDVVVGVIDTGIDFRHRDFIKTDGKTRIKALLDMTYYGTVQSGQDIPADPGWNYVLPGETNKIGHLYTEADINAALQAPKPTSQSSDPVKQRDKNGHGTHVTGTAAGNGAASSSPGTFAGMAPEADLVIVKTSRQNDTNDDFGDDDQINALAFIEQEAKELGKPFVINMSFGGHFSAHNGTDYVEEAIDDILTKDGVVGLAPGRAVCVAAGNSGDEDIHASGYVPSYASANRDVDLKLDARDFFTSGNPAISPDFFFLTYPETDRFSVTIIRPDGVSIGPFAYNGSLTYSGDLNPDANIDIVYNSDDVGVRDILIGFKSSAKNVKGADGSSIWTFRLRGDSVQGSGRFDAWVHDGGFLSPYVDGSRRVSTPATAEGAISVGAYVTRSAVQPVGEPATFTSPGPTADGRPKPDISAPGRALYSSKSSDSSFGTDQFGIGGSFHSISAGTSMSAPVVAGSVALLLQANPTLTTIQIKRLLTNFADNDTFTRPGWDARFGYGKLNVSAAINTIFRPANAINDSAFFVRQQYLDFLFREPDAAGQDAWLSVLNRCPNVNNDPTCDRIEVSASFFRSEEFQIKGYFVYRFYKASLGRRPRYVEIIPDMRSVTADTPQDRDAKKTAFTNAWVVRPEFLALYPNTMTDAAYVDKLLQTAGITLSSRNQLVSDLQAKNRTRADVLRAIVESQEEYNKEYNGAFVAMQYFGYLRRDAEQTGYDAWLRVINRGDSYRVMVDGFANSAEYKQRFGF